MPLSRKFGTAATQSYTEGTWTPTITFSTPGDLAVAYTTNMGTYTKIGRIITVTFSVITSSFTFTTASGNIKIMGLPFTPLTSSANSFGSSAFGGITKIGYTNINSFILASTGDFFLLASGSALAASNVVAADMPSGGTVVLGITHTYFAA